MSNFNDIMDEDKFEDCEGLDGDDYNDENIKIYNHFSPNCPYSLNEKSAKMSNLFRGHIEVDEEIRYGKLIRINPNYIESVEIFDFIINYMKHHAKADIEEAPPRELSKIEEYEVDGLFQDIPDIDIFPPAFITDIKRPAVFNNTRLIWKMIGSANYLGLDVLIKKLAMVLGCYYARFGGGFMEKIIRDDTYMPNDYDTDEELPEFEYESSDDPDLDAILSKNGMMDEEKEDI